MDLSETEAKRLLNDKRSCFPVHGKRQLVGVKDNKIYVFQDDNAGAYHAYRISGKECCSKYSSISRKIAELLGVNP
jgi:hypothetical protein